MNISYLKTITDTDRFVNIMLLQEYITSPGIANGGQLAKRRESLYKCRLGWRGRLLGL
jgi:hypothetical protein